MTEPTQHSETRLWAVGPIAGIAGLASTTLGIGGGAIMVPLFSLFARIPLKRCAGSSLAVVFATVSVGVAVQMLREPGDIVWPAVGALAIGAVVGSFIGKWLNHILPEKAFRYAFSAVLVLIALRLMGLTPESDPVAGALDFETVGTWAYLLAAGLTAGTASALFGLGGGVIIVPALTFGFDQFNDQFTATRATSMTTILASSLSGMILYWKSGTMDKRVVGIAVLFALPASVGGVFLAYAVDASYLRFAFAILVALMAVRLALFGSRRKSPKPTKKSSSEGLESNG